MTTKWTQMMVAAAAVLAAGGLFGAETGKLGPHTPRRWSLRIMTEGEPGDFRLLELEAVQRELGLTPEQQAQLDEARRQYEAAVAEQRAAGRPPDGLPRRRRWIERLRARVAALDTYRRRVEQILSPDQRGRLHQLNLQLNFVHALAETEVAIQLEISPEQKQRLQAIGQQLMERIRQLLRRREAPSSGWTDEQIAAEVERLRREAVAQALGVLTPEQRHRLDTLRGEPLPSEPTPVGPDASGSSGP